MAKNLKLKIKNTQLAEALKLTKGKKSTSTKAKTKKAEPEAKEKEAPQKKKLAPKVIKKAEKQRQVEEAAKAAERQKEPKPKEEELSSVPPETTPKQEAPKKEALPQEEELTPTTEETKSKPSKEEPSPAVAKKKKEAPTTTKDQEKKSAKVKKESKDGRPRKYETPRTFDSRDRLGLRSDEDRGWKKKRFPKHKGFKEEQAAKIVRPTQIKVRLPITVKDLAVQMKRKASEIIGKLFMQGVVVTINDYLDDETTVELIGHELGCAIEIDTSEERRLQLTDKSIQEEIQETDPKQLQPRAPVIAFMGHVDHGKTSLIDAIRKSDLASKEAGAITQHIGAFKCHREHGDITILDTPGHEAFTLMRERGAALTDIVIIVIAGDEGMRPQTEEAIDLAKNAGVPMIIALNKSDKQNFDADKVYRQLAEKDLLPEAWGGATITTNCSAVSNEGIPELLEMILLQAEMLELKANPSMRARGTVLESELHKGFGNVATILVQNGTLHHGDALVLDTIYGRIKTMHDEHENALEEALPSTPVKITGLSGLPEAGCDFIVVDNEKEAKKLCEDRLSGEQLAKLRQSKGESLENLMKRKSELSEKKVLPLIVKADVQGSLEALKNSLKKIPSKKVELNIISEGIGEVSESDVRLAETSNAPIIGYHTQIESRALELIKKNKIFVKLQDVIYHIIDDVKELMVETLDKIRKETESGVAVIKATFKASGLGVIAGCQVESGTIHRNDHVKLFRDGEQIWEGEIASLKRVKEDVKEVSKGFECGILLKDQNEVKEGDEIKAYTITYETQTLE